MGVRSILGKLAEEDYSEGRYVVLGRDSYESEKFKFTFTSKEEFDGHIERIKKEQAERGNYGSLGSEYFRLIDLHTRKLTPSSIPASLLVELVHNGFVEVEQGQWG